MPTSATVRTGLWKGGELVHTYDASSRLSSCSLFVPNDYTGVVAFLPLNLTLQPSYRAPVTGGALTPTAGGVVETLNTVLGMRWTVTPATAFAQTSMSAGISKTAP